MRKIWILVFSVIFMCGAMKMAAAASTDFQAGEVGVFSDYKIEYQLATGQSFEGVGQMAVKVMERNKFRINAGFMDGGGIALHNLAIIAVEQVDEETVIDLLLTVDGQPNKALFGAQLTADVITSAPGRYRVRLWLLEKFHDAGKQLLGESTVVLSDK